MTIAAGGFGLCGIPENLIQALVDSGVKGLTIVGNNAGVDDFGMGLLLKTPPGEEGDRLLRRREQGVRAPGARRRARAAADARRARSRRSCAPGGAGIPGFYTRTAFGTKLAEGKETKVFDGKEYVLEEAIRADLVHRQGLEGRQVGQPRLPQDRAQLQPDDRHLRQGHRRRGRGAGRGGRARPGPDPHAGHLRRPHRPGRRATRSASSSAPCRGARRVEEGLADPRADGASARRRSCATATT